MIQAAKVLIQALKDMNQLLKKPIQRLKRLNQVLKKPIQVAEIAAKARSARQNSTIIQTGYGILLNRLFGAEFVICVTLLARTENAQACCL